MKKLIATLLALVLALGMFACGNKNDAPSTTAPKTEPTQTTAPVEDTTAPVNTGVVEGAMTYAEYAAAELETEVTVACYVQATQSWWDNKITVYAADKDGAYFLYELACSEEDSKKMVPGTLLKVKGVKGAWAGEVEIMDATFEFVDSAEKFVATPVDLTAKLASDELINYQNQLAAFKAMTVKEISYKNGEPGDDIYVTLTKDGKDYNFCVERYLTDPESDVYKTVGTLKAGDVVDVEGFLYWYEGVNPHITKIGAAAESAYDKYIAAEMDSEVIVECYVQATQSWWDNKISVYAADADGAYFIYELACTEEDSKKLTPGTKIKVTGSKGAWAGEVEIMDGVFEFVDGADTFVAEVKDLTDKIASEDLINYQNQLVAFKGLTVKEISYKNGEPGDDIYVTLTLGDKDYNFCVERYLTDPDTEVYKTVGELKAGDKVDVEGFLYWYEGMNPHITKITKA